MLKFEEPFCFYIGTQVSNCLFENRFWIFFLIKFIKNKHILSSFGRKLHLMVLVSLPPKSLVYEGSFLCYRGQWFVSSIFLKKGASAFSLLIFNEGEILLFYVSFDSWLKLALIFMFSYGFYRYANICILFYCQRERNWK